MRKLFFPLVLTISAQSSVFAETPHYYAGKGARGDVIGGLAFSTSETDYEVDSGNDFTIERDVLSADISYFFDNELALYGTLSLVASSEIEGVFRHKGDGIGFGLGVKGLAYSNKNISVIPYGELSILMEEHKINSTSVKTDTQLYEIGGGAVVRFNLQSNFYPHIGANLVPVSNGEIKTSAGAFSSTIDFERDSLLGLKFGGAIELEKVKMYAELNLLASTGFVIGATSEL